MIDIEHILGNEILQDYYDNKNISGAIDELKDNFAPVEFQKLKDYIEIKAGIEMYNDGEKKLFTELRLGNAINKEVSFDKIICDYFENEDTFRETYRSRFKRQYENT